ncbi:hypothetical protein HZA56_08020 [Candidatus Poribacteria bacterium]|nr:hypothetical protein [Candidatus Poribacteria bacterium]
MTHTLNRRGLSEARPGEEIVVLCMAQRLRKAEKAEAMQSLARTVLKYKPDNFVGKPLGFDAESVEAMAPYTGVVTAVFTDKEVVWKLVGDLKSQRLGVSVVLSGLFTDVRDTCKCTGLREHTYHISLGIFGKTDCLPGENTLEITTQCGHSLISPHLVDAVVKKIRKGKMTCEQGAQMLIKPCACGIGNPKRVEEILRKMV